MQGFFLLSHFDALEVKKVLLVAVVLVTGGLLVPISQLNSCR